MNKRYKVFIGSSSFNILEQQVLIETLKKTSTNYDYYILDADNNQCIDQFGYSISLSVLPLSAATKFSWSRFCVPALSNYEGLSLYIDSDQMIFKDLSLLIRDFDEKCAAGAVSLKNAKVNHFYKKRILEPLQAKDKGKLYLTSVMVFNNSHFKGVTIDNLFELVSSGALEYKDVMFLSEKFLLKMNFKVHDINPIWNYLDTYDSEVGILHFTELLTQPWKSVFHPFEELWIKEFVRVCEEGWITNAQIEQALKKNVISSSTSLLPFLRNSKKARFKYRLFRSKEMVTQSFQYLKFKLIIYLRPLLKLQ